MEQIQKLWTGILDVLSKLVIPDWGALIALLPVFLVALVVLWLLLTLRSFATVGPRQRRPQLAPVPPAGLHAPGPSYAPVLGAIGAAALVAALVVRGAALPFAVLILVLALLYWLREFMAEYEHVAGATTLPVPMEHPGPPAGIHMPGPSFLPLGTALATALLVVGVVVGGWVLIGAVVCLIVALAGWMRAARAEWRHTEEADRTGHIRNEPAPGFPMRLFAFFAIVMIAAFSIEAGFLPPRATSSGGSAGASPGPSGAASVPPASAGTAADVTIRASSSQFTTPQVTAPAAKPFSLAFDNEDAGTLHNVHIKKADGSDAFKGEFVTGVSTKVYQVPALPAGSYPFMCDVHPSMTGTLTVH
jgi:plastocyanin